MRKRNLLKIGCGWKTLRWVIFLLITISAAFVPDAKGQQMVTVRVLIEWTSWNDCDDGVLGGPPEIYHDVYVDGVKLTSEDDPIYVNIAPFTVNNEFSLDVDVSKRNIPIVIQEWDDDSPWSSDDKCDIDPGSGRDLDLNLDLATCQISGDVSGICGTSITISNSTTYFVFKISVEEPPHAAGLGLRCLHDPIWPQPGDTVTVTVEALDGTANPMTGIVDDIEVWVDNTTTAAATTATTPGSFGANLFTINHTPAAGANQILYRCRVRDGSLWVSSGWRIVQIGQPARGRAIPVLYTGVPDSRVDIVFIADQTDYNGPNDPQFLTDVHTVIRDSYYASDATFRNGGRLFLINQDAINFWIALDTGDAVPYCTTCSHVLPAGWNTAYSFADSGAIVHSTNFRDFAQKSRRIFSSEPTSIGVFLHETGHSPFGLADEYCCDGGYFNADPHPNIYSSQSDCLGDPLASGATGPCQQIQRAGNTVNWFRVEEAATLGNDLMEDSGGHTVRPADERRLNWYFDLCREGGC